MAHHTAGVIEAQADWLTMMLYGQRRIQEGIEWAQDIAVSEDDAGGIRTKFPFQGIAMTRCGRVAFGQLSQVGSVQLSGDLAAQHLETAISLASRISRVDLAVTLRTADTDDELGRRAYEQATEHYRSRKHAASVECRETADRGFTLYVGKRDGQRFFRLYNKQRECEAEHDPDAAGRYANCWRYELECKQSLASTAAMALRDAPVRTAYVQEQLHHYLQQHGVRPEFGVADSGMYLRGFRRRSDIDSRRLWLRTHASRTCRTVAGHVGWQSVIADLGIPPNSYQTPTDY